MILQQIGRGARQTLFLVLPEAGLALGVAVLTDLAVHVLPSAAALRADRDAFALPVQFPVGIAREAERTGARCATD